MMMKWEEQQRHEDQHQQHRWRLLLESQSQREMKISINDVNHGGTMFVKVMTDEQLETLRKQIAVYSTICDQLVEMHKNLTAQQDLAGGKLGSIYCDSLMTSNGHKLTARQRWTPTPVQLQILERIFDQGTGTPSKQKIKEITMELNHHGQISETNVYNWFQNRRARSKRKQQAANCSAGESEVDTDIESPNEKKIKPEINLLHCQQNHASSKPDDLCYQNPELTSEFHPLGALPNPRDDRLTGKMGIPGGYNLYNQTEDYSMAG